ncbi:MAG: sugar transferase [Gemmatimonadetes bacterium]|nr:sugar transferase [Gemmatimonadota bacterium]
MIRLVDFVASTIALALLAPLFLVVMLVLRFTGEHEVFYLQERVGLGGRPFRVLKFATMLKESPNLAGGFLTQKDDPRVLPFGRILRKWKVNELPQLLNVWLGQMSLVGPRPQAAVHYHLYNARQKAAIDSLTPGLTGLGSLIFRDEEGLLERSGLGFDYVHDELITPYKGDLELWYAANRSIVLYFRILFLTAISILVPGGSYLESFPGLPQPPAELRRLL